MYTMYYNDYTFGTPILEWNLESLTLKKGKIIVRNGKICIKMCVCVCSLAHTRAPIFIPIYRLPGAKKNNSKIKTK